MKVDIVVNIPSGMAACWASTKLGAKVLLH